MFDLTDVSSEDNYAPITDGTYPAYVEKADFRESKAGTEYLNLQFKIFGERSAGRVFFNIMNVFHEKEQVRNIALGELKRMFSASGITDMKFNSKEELLESVLTCRMQVKLGNKTDSYGTKNVIKGYSKLEESDNDILGSGGMDSNDVPF